jgi:23S rRNA pseudouridine1911/1915/1917 synthase
MEVEGSIPSAPTMSEPEVIYEDKNLLALNKPSGLLVHEARGIKHEARKEPTLVGWLIEHYPEIKTVGDDPTLRPGIVHRLDKDASGIMLIARTGESFEYLKSLFGTRQIHKTYRALVFGAVKGKAGVIEKPIGIKNGTLKRSVRSEKMAKEAITEYRVIRHGAWGMEYEGGKASEFSLLEVVPKTGRTHQIRVHLASIGHPIVGDKLYGPKRQPEWAKRLMLHALSLEFTTVDGRRTKLEAEMPEEFKNITDKLKNSS